MTYRIKLSFLVTSAVLALASPAFSQDDAECQSDADCDEGFACEKGFYSNPCDPDAGPCDSGVYEEEFGTCVRAPVACETDADCGEYLACTESGSSGSCWQSSDGTSGCTEPDPDPEMYCAPSFSACETDEDCPRSFECVSGESCTAVDCADGEDCDLPACEPTGGECVPQEIECDADADCPSEWSCVTWTEYSCTGGGEGDSGGGVSVGGSKGDSGGSEDPAADPLPAPEPQEVPEETCVETSGGGMCQPNGWDGYYDGSEPGSATGDDGEVENEGAPRGAKDSDPTESGDLDRDASSDSSGCSVHAGGGSSPSPLGLLFLLGAPLAAFRRRLTSSS